MYPPYCDTFVSSKEGTYQGCLFLTEIDKGRL